MNIELDENEQATLIGLLVEVIETSKLPSSPRLKAALSILAKLGIDALAVNGAPPQEANPSYS
jgi:hypothetical protein